MAVLSDDKVKAVMGRRRCLFEDGRPSRGNPLNIVSVSLQSCTIVVLKVDITAPLISYRIASKMAVINYLRNSAIFTLSTLFMR